MILLIILIAVEIMTFIVIRKMLYDRSWIRYYLLTLANISLSILLWVVWFQLSLFRGPYDDSRHVSLMLALNGLLSAVVVPRIIIIITFYAGSAMKNLRSSRILKTAGMGVALFISTLIATGTLIGRYNFHTEHISLHICDLHKELDGLRIVHISDLHLPSFYHNSDRLVEVMNEINELDPDILINTGDFVNYGWREFIGYDTILGIAKSRYGNYAVLGNHDFGTYHPYYTQAERRNNVLIMNNMVNSSGYRVLNDESVILNIGSARLGIAGVITMGSFPDIIHGNLIKAISGIDSTDLNILLTHDPNHWIKEVKNKADIQLTLSGHTHGMQIGVYTRKFRWSPARYFYPFWGGLYNEGDQYLVVNRGLGILGIPCRIWMPPEITVIELKTE
ncbi:MAG: metallophosphoesterase [Bacteroidales bacterium]|jgi:predicted MPP superfamily phosphohydrolase|nr:metallophosphoesterase [Bacteroidales bacterium]